MLRIVSLNYEYPPIGGGGGNAHQHLLRALSEFDDIDLTLIAPTLAPEGFTTHEGERIRIHHLPLPNKQARLYWRRGEIVRYLWQHDRFFARHLREHRYDLCHVFFGFPTGVIAWRRCGSMPYAVSVRGSDVPGYNPRFTLDHALLRPLMSRIYRQASAVVANSQGLRSLFESQFPGLQASVIPNGVDIQRFRPLNDEDRQWNALATVARLIPRKGIDRLLQACGRLHEWNRDFQCHIVGEGPEREALEQQARALGIADRIHFHGDRPREWVAQALPAHGLFVLPSLAEGMPNAALEAMACGLPLVLSDTGGSAELVDGNGCIVPVGDADALAYALHDALRDSNRLRQWARRSRERALNFSWRRVAEDYRTLYDQIANPERRPVL